MEALAKIQQELVAPKNLVNKFGGYNYRSCEGILEAVKPLLKKYHCTLLLSDDICSTENVPQMVITDDATKPKTKTLSVGNLVFVQATAIIKCGDEVESVTAQAAIDVNKAGMDYAQAFGASSSYARKYALNGLFLIDDTKDADATNQHGKDTPTKAEVKKLDNTSHNKAFDSAAGLKVKDSFKKKLEAAKSVDDVDSIIKDCETIWNDWPDAWISGMKTLADARDAEFKAGQL